MNPATCSAEVQDSLALVARIIAAWRAGSTPGAVAALAAHPELARDRRFVTRTAQPASSHALRPDRRLRRRALPAGVTGPDAGADGAWCQPDDGGDHRSSNPV